MTVEQFVRFLYIIFLLPLFKIINFFWKPKTINNPQEQVRSAKRQTLKTLNSGSQLHDELFIRGLTKYSLIWNPFHKLSGIIETEKSSLFPRESAVFKLWPAQHASSVQYHEFTIKGKDSLSKDQQLPSMGFFIQNSSLATPLSSVVEYQKQSFIGVDKIDGIYDSLAIPKSLKIGDSIGIGIMPVSDLYYLLYGTYNGEWIGYFTWKDEYVATRIADFLKYDLVIHLSDNSLNTQISFGIDESVEFDGVFDLEACSLCQSNLPMQCMHTLSTECCHRICQYCILDLAMGTATPYIDNSKLNTSCETCLSADFDQIIFESVGFSTQQKLRIKECKLLARPNVTLCPYRKCDGHSVVEEDNPDYPKVKCSTCKCSFCCECNVPWHSNKTCEEYKKFVADEARGWSMAEPLSKDEEARVKKLIKRNQAVRCSKCNTVCYKDTTTAIHFFFTTVFCSNCKNSMTMPHRTVIRGILDARKTTKKRQLAEKEKEKEKVNEEKQKKKDKKKETKSKNKKKNYNLV